MHHGPEFTVVLIASVALLVGAGLRLLAGRLRFPYTIAVLLFGIAAGVLLEQTGVAHGEGLGHAIARGAFISSDLIIFVFLPALVFESAYAIEVHDFKKNMGAVLVLAIPALVMSTVLVAVLMRGLTHGSWGWSWSGALVFGALISATDPVAVVAILRELGVSKRLGVLIEGESLLNDGTSIVVFFVLLSMLTGEASEFSAVDAAWRFVEVAFGGVLVGLSLSFVLSKWIERLFNDPLAEITLTLVLAYSAMILAEGVLHVSGVIAVVVSGLWMSGQGRTKISPEVSHFLHRFWGMLGYVANTLIFFLVGLVIAVQVKSATAADLGLIAGAYLAAMAVRFAITYLFQPVVARLSEGVTGRDSAVISWGGLRGAVSLALALVISQTEAVDAELRRQILLVTAGVVFLTIAVNGTTIGRLLAWLGYDRAPLGEQLARLNARALVLDGVHRSIDEISRSRDLRTVSWGEVNAELERRQAEVDEAVGRVRQELGRAPDVEREAGYWTRLIAIERQSYWEAFAQGTLGAAAVRLLSGELDRHGDRLGRGELVPPPTRVPNDAVDRGIARFFGLSPGRAFERLSLIYDLSRAEARAAERVLASLDTLRDAEPGVVERIRATYQGYLRAGKERVEDIRTNLPEMASAIENRLARRIQLNLEREGYERLARRGALDEATAAAELSSVEEQMHELVRRRERVAIPETADLVASTPLFASLTDDALAELAEITEEMVLPAGEYLFHENDKGDALYVIARGAVHVIVGKTIVDVLGGGDILGEISLLTGAPRTASIRAATSVTLGKITRERFDRLMDRTPELRQEVWHAFARRTFDNAVRDSPRFAHLDRRARLAWIDSGTVREVAAEQTLAIDRSVRYVFVLTGAIRLNDEEHGTGELVHVSGARALVGVEAGRLVLLPEWLGSIQA